MTDVNLLNKDMAAGRLATTAVFVGGAKQTEYSEKSRWQITNNVRTILSVLIGECELKR